MKLRGAGLVAAQVILRSVSGKSLRELGEGAAPADLSPYLAPQSARETVCRAFESRGFRVFRDDLGLVVSIEGPPSLFAKSFGVSEQTVQRVPAAQTVALEPPEDVKSLVEGIVLVPSPELFG